VSHIGYTTNEYGTKVSSHRCDTCGRDFTVCPAAFPEERGWENCMAATCASYDRSRDVDRMLETGEVSVVLGGQRTGVA
jgi:hypothetical protein